MARLHIRAGDDESAEAVYSQIAAEYADHPGLSQAVRAVAEAYHDLALGESADGANDKAADHFAKALAKWTQIIALRRPSSEAAPATYFAGVCHRRLGDHLAAAEHFQTVVEKWPTYKYAWSAQCLIGESYEKLRKADVVPAEQANPKIEQAYKALIENYSDCSLVGHACTKLGRFYYELENWPGAAKYFGMFLEKYPDNIRWHNVLYALARTFDHMGNSTAAAELYEMFVADGLPSDARVHFALSRINALKGGQQ